MKLKEIFFYALGVLIVLGFFLFLGMIILRSGDSSLQNIMLGALIGAFTTVVTYYYGSSKSSADKTEMIHNSTPIPPPNETIN